MEKDFVINEKEDSATWVYEYNMFDKKYKMTENYEIFAMTFLVPEVIITAEGLQQENNETISNGVLYVSSGVQSNLLFVFGNDGIEYIEYYNNKRIKSKLKGMSPVQYRVHSQVA